MIQNSCSTTAAIHACELQQNQKHELAADSEQEDDGGSWGEHLSIGEGVQSSVSNLLLGRALEEVQQILPPFICSSLTIKETAWHRSQCAYQTAVCLLLKQYHNLTAAV